MQEVTRCMSLVFLGALVTSLGVEGGNVLHTPVWFTRLMAERNCIFTHMLYANDQCELKLFFNGEFPSYMQVIGLGLDDDLVPDTAEFGAAICRCGVMEYAGICSDQMLHVLSGLREACGVDNLRFLPSLGLTQQQWMDRESPKVYQTVRMPLHAIDMQAEAEIVSRSLKILGVTNETGTTTQQPNDAGETSTQELTTLEADVALDADDNYEYETSAGLYF